MKKIIKTDNAPAAIGPYSQAVAVDSFIFTAGQIALSPETGEIVGEDVAAQTQQVVENLKAIIESSGGDLSSVVKTTVYLTDPGHFSAMNEVYAKYFTDQPPARTTVFVNALPSNVLVEIDAIVKLSVD